MPPESPLAELDALNRAKRDIAARGQAGTPDIPYLYELYLQQQQGDQMGFGAPMAPIEDEQGGNLPLDFRASPGAEAGTLGFGASAPAGAAQSPLAPRAPQDGGDFRIGGEGLRASNPISGVAPSYSPELESFLDTYFGALKDPTTIARAAPVIGSIAGIVEGIQEEDYMGSALSALGLLGPAALAAVSAAQIDPSLIGDAISGSVTQVDPVSVAQNVISSGGREPSLDFTPGEFLGPSVAGVSDAELQQAQQDVFSELGGFPGELRDASVPGPGQRGFADGPEGLSPGALRAYTAGAGIGDVPQGVSAELAGAGLTPGGFARPEEDDDFDALLDAGYTPAQAAQVLGRSIAPGPAPVTATALRSLAAAPALSGSFAAGRAGGSSSSFGGGGRGGFTPSFDFAGSRSLGLRGGDRGGGGGRGGGRGPGSASGPPGGAGGFGL